MSIAVSRARPSRLHRLALRVGLALIAWGAAAPSETLTHEQALIQRSLKREADASSMQLAAWRHPYGAGR